MILDCWEPEIYPTYLQTTIPAIESANLSNDLPARDRTTPYLQIPELIPPNTLLPESYLRLSHGSWNIFLKTNCNPSTILLRYFFHLVIRYDS